MQQGREETTKGTRGCAFALSVDFSLRTFLAAMAGAVYAAAHRRLDI